MIERDMDIRYADTVSDLTAYQRQIICAVYKHSKSLDDLITKLSVIKFCDFETSVDVLVERGFIDKRDKKYLMNIKYHKDNLEKLELCEEDNR